MTALLVVLLVVLFLVVDIAVREVSKRNAAKRALAERRAVLETAVSLDFADEAKSLKRAEVPNAKGRILAVDDEAVILDSFRKILVLAGFSVDTVQHGPEALTLVRRNNYDFLFTDLKMPDMDGVEVVKAVKHLRPDIDVAVITGYATIETAVETMRFGALDYVQKPFTEDELVAFANRMLVKRQSRLEAQARPTVRVVAPAVAETVADREYCVPGGAFVAPGHTWARIDPAGQVWIGADDFARKVLGKIEKISLPSVGAVVRRGDPIVTLSRGGQSVRLPAPVSGQVTSVNEWLAKEPQHLTKSPYDKGWVCLLRPASLGEELQGLRIGKPVVGWYQEEIARLRTEAAAANKDELSWSELEARFFAPGVAKPSGVTETVAAV